MATGVTTTDPLQQLIEEEYQNAGTTLRRTGPTVGEANKMIDAGSSDGTNYGTNQIPEAQILAQQAQAMGLNVTPEQIAAMPSGINAADIGQYLANTTSGNLWQAGNSEMSMDGGNIFTPGSWATPADVQRQQAMSTIASLAQKYGTLNVMQNLGKIGQYIPGFDAQGAADALSRKLTLEQAAVAGQDNPFEKFLGQALPAVIGIGGGIVTGGVAGGGLMGGAVGGATAGATTSAANGQDVLSGALKGAALGTAGAGIAQGVNSTGLSNAVGGGTVGNAATGAATGAIKSTLTGGNPVSGALWGAGGSLANSAVNNVSSAGGTGTGDTTGAGSGGVDINSINGDVGAPAPAPGLTDFTNGMPAPDPNGYTPADLGGDTPTFSTNPSIADLGGNIDAKTGMPVDNTNTVQQGGSMADDSNFDSTYDDVTGENAADPTQPGYNDVANGDTNAQPGSADNSSGIGGLVTSILGRIAGATGGGSTSTRTGSSGSTTGQGGAGNPSGVNIYGFGPQDIATLLGAVSNRGNAQPTALQNLQAQALQRNNDIAQSMWQRYSDVYKPLQDRAIGDANNIDSEANQNRVAGVANADVTGAFDRARQQNLERLRELGVNPNSGAFIDAATRLAGQEAGANASLQNTSRQGLIDRGMQARAALAGATGNTPFQTMAGGVTTAGGAGAAASGVRAGNTADNAALGGLISKVGSGVLNPVVGGVRDWVGSNGGWGNMTSGWGGTSGSGSTSDPGTTTTDSSAVPSASQYANGGLVHSGYANGGAVHGPGTGTSDSIPVAIRGAGGVRRGYISDGEFVVPSDVVRAKGTDFFNKMVEQYHTPVRGGVRR